MLTDLLPSSGSEFIFKGLQKNIQEIRSLEGVIYVSL